MILYHLTPMENQKSIKKNGLNASLKNSDTFAMGKAINKFLEHPNYIGRNNCLFFRVFEPFFMEEEQLLVTVNSDDLDYSKLFVCDEELADKIHHSSQISALNYLNHLISFEKYLEDTIKYNDEFENVEVMHIGNIPKEKIKIHF